VDEHRIRLRGGWECRTAGSLECEERRLTLPVRWGSEDCRRLVLTRRFGRPPLDQGRQVLLLKMDQVEGIVSLVLNGRPIGATAAATRCYEIEVTDLAERNVLVLEVELPESRPDAAGSREEWGVIALVVRPLVDDQRRSTGIVEEFGLE
jgi:hypothetical protein